MAMTSKFGADFVEFYDASAKATAQLDTMATASAKVDTSVGTMAKSMDGAATTVTAGMTTMSTSSTKTTNSFTALATQMQTADKSLAAFGVSVSPVTNVLTEVGQVAGKTVTELGALGTATTALAVGLGTFKATSFILEMTGANKALNDFYQNLFKYRTAGQETAAQQDVINKALRDGAAAGITFAEAVEFNRQKANAFTAQWDTAANSVAKWEGEIAKVRKSGNYGQLVQDMKDGNSTAADLQRRYNLSAEALDYLTRKTKAQSDAWKEAHEPALKAAAAAKAHAEAIQQLSERMLGTGAIKAAQDYVAALGPLANLQRMSTEEQTKLNTTISAALDVYSRMGVVAPQALRDVYVATVRLPPVTAGLGAEWANVGEKVEVSIDKVLAGLAKVQSQEEKNQAFYKQLDAEIAAAYQTAQDGANAATGATQQTTGAVNQLASAYRNVASTAAEYKTLAAGMEFDAAYNARQGGTAAMMGMFQAQAAKNMRAQAGLLEQREAYVSSATANTPWGTSLAISVDARSTGDRVAGEDIASAVVNGMRREGIRLGR
jgi:hypothetical protein